jgi:hypothetical protein
MLGTNRRIPRGRHGMPIEWASIQFDPTICSSETPLPPNCTHFYFSFVLPLPQKYRQARGYLVVGGNLSNPTACSLSNNWPYLVGSCDSHAQISTSHDIINATLLCILCLPVPARLFRRFLADAIPTKTARLKGVRGRIRALIGVLGVAILYLEQLGLTKG